LNLNYEFVRGDKNAEGACDTRQHGGCVACRTDLSVVDAERRRAVSMRRQVICRHSDRSHLGPDRVWTGS